MARPLKEGLDYFSLDCYMDSKVKLIQAEYGLKGFAIVVKLWQMIYTLMLVYGGIRQGSLTLHLQRHYDQPFDRIRIANSIYRVDQRRNLRTKQVFIVSEVQG